MKKQKKASAKPGKTGFSFTHDLPKKEKAARAKYLSKRINELLDNLSVWTEDWGKYSFRRHSIIVEGEKLPSADIFSGKKLIAGVKPAGLFAFGFNSRIDIVSGKTVNIIFDVSKASSQPDWQLIPSDAGKKPRKLTKMIFRNLLKKMEAD